MTAKITQEEFIEGYCARSFITPAQFHEFGHAAPCDCDEPSCEGWQYVTREVGKIHIDVPMEDLLAERVKALCERIGCRVLSYPTPTSGVCFTFAPASPQKPSVTFDLIAVLEALCGRIEQLEGRAK